MKNGNSQGKGRGAKGRRNNKSKQEAAKRPGPARQKWTPPPLLTTPIPQPLCRICSKPIKDLVSAFADTASGGAVHFDCARSSVIKRETLSEGDVVSYIGGGRFAVIYFESRRAGSFKIKKIIEWENHEEERALWRNDIADHFSLT
ncbi:MAG: hypothetical protein LBC77_07425 [Spirochaetaceae bacterium]|jgi:hypothetical protein|nr:hypothetical protein [Spirochaetaceae bacterium]